MPPEFSRKIADYAVRQTAGRLDRLAYQIGRTSKSAGPDSVHDLRVAIRRFLSCLRVFRPYFPQREVKRVRKRLREVMKLAGEVRNRDVAMELGQKASLPSDSALLATWSEQRGLFAQQLAALLKRSAKRNFSDKWRSRLNL